VARQGEFIIVMHCYQRASESVGTDTDASSLKLK
jgi:hypothetical protein